MYRKVTQYLLKWKDSPHRKPLILQGARQVGKTYALLEFGKEHYENVAYFNFETNPSLIKTFEESIEPSYLVPILSRLAGQTIVREKTLVITLVAFYSENCHSVISSFRLDFVTQ